ncbi:MAG: flavin reductase family protein [Solirubrobacterales bacterium]|nr:flavin reductase family protein [Solirubrobacterales bacterium]
MPIDPRDFRDAMGRFATGVAIVTCDGPNGPSGLTTNAISSLSLDPLLLLVCFDNTSRTLDAVKRSGRFAVNMLRAEHEELASTFASKREQHEKFEVATHRIEHGVPVLDDALSWLACDVHDLLPGGDHTIGVGRVTQTWTSPQDGPPLIFYSGMLRQTVP